MPCSTSEAIRFRVASASSNPRMPPTPANSTLSVSIWRTIRMLLAPSTLRIAISFWRAVARLRRRLATLAQAMSRTNPTAASKTVRAGRISATALSFRKAKLS